VGQITNQVAVVARLDMRVMVVMVEQVARPMVALAPLGRVLLVLAVAVAVVQDRIAETAVAVAVAV
jgi:hypothetical protein